MRPAFTEEALYALLSRLEQCQQLVRQPRPTIDTLVQIEMLLEDAIRDLRKLLGIKQWPEPTVHPPDMETLEAWLWEEGGCEATDSCWVEADGTCPHGHPSWLLKLGLI